MSSDLEVGVRAVAGDEVIGGAEAEGLAVLGQGGCHITSLGGGVRELELPTFSEMFSTTVLGQLVL